MTIGLPVTARRFEVPIAVTLSLIVQTAVSLLGACVPVLAPDIAGDRGWNVAFIALYPTILFGSAFIISFKVPAFLASLGGMGLSLACLALCAVGMLSLLSANIALIIVTPIVLGCASASMNPASSQILVSRTTATNASLIMSIKQTGVPLGGVLAGALVPLLVFHFGWRLVLIELAAGSIILTLLLLPSVNWLDGEAISSAPRAYRPLAPLKRLLAIPGMLPLLLASFVFTGMQLCLRSFFVAYLVNDQKLSLSGAGLAFSLSQAAGIVGQIGWAAISDRVLGAHFVMGIIGFLMAVAAALTAAMTPDWPMVVIAIIAVVFGGTAAAFVPVMLGEIARRSPPGEAGALTSGGQLFLMSGALIGPLVFGAITSWLSFSEAFAVMAGCTLAAAVMAVIPYRTTSVTSLDTAEKPLRE
jgi:predicted MFS family arabinose efflux permease